MQLCVSKNCTRFSAVFPTDKERVRKPWRKKHEDSAFTRPQGTLCNRQRHPEKECRDRLRVLSERMCGNQGEE